MEFTQKAAPPTVASFSFILSRCAQQAEIRCQDLAPFLLLPYYPELIIKIGSAALSRFNHSSTETSELWGGSLLSTGTPRQPPAMRETVEYHNI